MKPETKTQLISAIKNAEIAALKVDIEPNYDGGSCNFDSPAIRIPRISDTIMQEIAKVAGVGLYPFTWFGKQRWYWVQVSMNGQAYRRTTMMEAALKVLKDETPEEVEVCGYYQMD